MTLLDKFRCPWFFVVLIIVSSSSQWVYSDCKFKVNFISPEDHSSLFEDFCDFTELFSCIFFFTLSKLNLITLTVFCQQFHRVCKSGFNEKSDMCFIKCSISEQLHKILYMTFFVPPKTDIRDTAVTKFPSHKFKLCAGWGPWVFS